MTASPHAIKVSNLSKQYGGGFRSPGVLALIDVSLEVNRGEIFGLLGPNGAGKTTLVKTLLGALLPTSGSALVDGQDVCSWKARRNVGFLPENHRFPLYLTGAQMLAVFGGMSGLSLAQAKSKTDHLLEIVDLKKWRNTKIKKYSKGMMQRLGLAQVMITDPDIIFLDEPTDGVDPIGRREIRQILVELKGRGKTIFLNSHLLAEVEAVCDRVAILDKGRLIKTGPVSGLVKTKPGYKVETLGISPAVREGVIATFNEASIESNTITISMGKAVRINDLIDFLRKNNVEILSVTPLSMSLEDSFMKLIKGAGDEGGGDDA